MKKKNRQKCPVEAGMDGSVNHNQPGPPGPAERSVNKATKDVWHAAPQKAHLPVHKRPKLHRILNARIIALNTRFEQTCMTQDQDTRRSDEPKKGAKGIREPDHGNSNHKQAGV